MHFQQAAILFLQWIAFRMYFTIIFQWFPIFSFISIHSMEYMHWDPFFVCEVQNLVPFSFPTIESFIGSYERNEMCMHMQWCWWNITGKIVYLNLYNIWHLTFIYVTIYNNNGNCFSLCLYVSVAHTNQKKIMHNTYTIYGHLYTYTLLAYICLYARYFICFITELHV